jgi:serine/threonine protein kinase
LSKRLTEVTSNSKSNNIGIIEYVEPQCLRSVDYMRNKKSDVYSLGVLLWEITSGHPPFHKAERDMLGYHIGRGQREEPIKGTPPEYQQLYQRCWDGDPEKRPDINEVCDDILRQFNANDINEQQEDLLVAPICNSLDSQSGQLGLCIETGSIDCNQKHVNNV